MIVIFEVNRLFLGKYQKKKLYFIIFLKKKSKFVAIYLPKLYAVYIV